MCGPGVKCPYFKSPFGAVGGLPHKLRLRRTFYGVRGYQSIGSSDKRRGACGFVRCVCAAGHSPNTAQITNALPKLVRNIDSHVIPETCVYAITENTMETDPGLRCQTKIFVTSKRPGDDMSTRRSSNETKSPEHMCGVV